MKSYDTFVFDSFDFQPETGIIELRYSMKGDEGAVQFTEKLLLGRERRSWAQVDLDALHRALFALHLLGGVSYYKTCLPKHIEVLSGQLIPKQAAFFESVYENGLGEFFYKNKIDFRNLIHFPSEKVPSAKDQVPSLGTSHLAHGTSKRALVPIGGGKDSLVTAELLKHAGYDVTLFRMGNHPLIEELAKTAGMPLLTIERHLSPALFDLNAEGALNGHVPITAYLSCVAVIVAILEGFDAVVLSNERSASYGNVEMFGKEINHQWSKSLEFERAFQQYLADFVTKDVSYFSLLRPLSELHISKLYCEHPEYFDHATSCNTNWRILKEKPKEKWCRKCPKCAFAFVMFAPFIEEKTLIGMFGGNPFADAELLPLFKELIGLEGFKPFECVGTPEETKAALYLIHQKKGFSGTPVMQMFEKDIFPKIKNPEKLVEECLTPSSDHAIPEECANIF